jgi:hypothetical protein
MTSKSSFNLKLHLTISCKWASNNRPTKRGKEKSHSDGHCQCEKKWMTIYKRVN